VNDIVGEILRDIPDILNGNKEKMVEDAEKLGKYLADNELSTSQIRNIFSETKRMRSYEKNKNELILLRPKLAYIAGRHGKKDRRTGKLVGPVPDLSKVLDECIKKIHNETHFKNFKDFFEAILAYHRYYGGKE